MNTVRHSRKQSFQVFLEQPLCNLRRIKGTSSIIKIMYAIMRSFNISFSNYVSFRDPKEGNTCLNKENVTNLILRSLKPVD